MMSTANTLNLLGQAEQERRLKETARELELAGRALASSMGRGYVDHEDYGIYPLGWKIVILAHLVDRTRKEQQR